MLVEIVLNQVHFIREHLVYLLEALDLRRHLRQHFCLLIQQPVGLVELRLQVVQVVRLLLEVILGLLVAVGGEVVLLHHHHLSIRLVTHDRLLVFVLLLLVSLHPVVVKLLVVLVLVAVLLLPACLH